MRVTLIKPRNPNIHDSAVIPSVGLGYLCTQVRRRGHDVEILDAVKERWSPEQLIAELHKKRSDVYGISCFSNTFQAGIHIAHAVKSHEPASLIVMGGPHATFEPEEVLQETSVDIAVVSEGEEAFPDLVELCRNGEHRDHNALLKIPNLVFHHKGKVCRTPVRHIPDIDLLGLPAWDIIRPETYPLAPHGLFARRGPVCPIVATRGCPYPCLFCGAGRIMGRRLRKRSQENILEEIHLLHERHGILEFHFLDDNFTLDTEWAMGLCDGIIRKDFKILWSLTNGVRLDTLHETLIRRMEKAGCYSMGVGIESGSEKVLDRIRKGITLQEVREKVSLIKRVSSIRIVGFFILGLPFETRSDMEHTIQVSCELPLDAAYFGNYIPFPGSPLYDELKQSGALDSIPWDVLCLEYNSPLLPEGITPGEMQRLVRRAFCSFYLRPRILTRLLRDLRGVRQVVVLMGRVGRILLGGTLLALTRRRFSGGKREDQGSVMGDQGPTPDP